jgi:hypothetical protein
VVYQIHHSLEPWFWSLISMYTCANNMKCQVTLVDLHCQILRFIFTLMSFAKLLFTILLSFNVETLKMKLKLLYVFDPSQTICVTTTKWRHGLLIIFFPFKTWIIKHSHYPSRHIKTSSNLLVLITYKVSFDVFCSLWIHNDNVCKFLFFGIGVAFIHMKLNDK